MAAARAAAALVAPARDTQCLLARSYDRACCPADRHPGLPHFFSSTDRWGQRPPLRLTTGARGGATRVVRPSKRRCTGVQAHLLSSGLSRAPESTAPRCLELSRTRAELLDPSSIAAALLTALPSSRCRRPPASRAPSRRRCIRGRMPPRQTRGKAAAAAQKEQQQQQQQHTPMSLHDRKPIELENGWRYMEVSLGHCPMGRGRRTASPPLPCVPTPQVVPSLTTCLFCLTAGWHHKAQAHPRRQQVRGTGRGVL